MVQPVSVTTFLVNVTMVKSAVVQSMESVSVATVNVKKVGWVTIVPVEILLIHVLCLGKKIRPKCAPEMVFANVGPANVM